MRLNLLPPERHPHKAILAGNVRAAQASFCAPTVRPLVVIAAALVFIGRWVVSWVVIGAGILLAIPIAVALGPLIALGILGFWCYRWICGESLPRFDSRVWCVVVECAPEEVAALQQTLREVIEPEQRLTTLHTHLPREVTLGESELDLPSAPGPLFSGGKLTMQWLAARLGEQKIPCHVVRRYPRQCQGAIPVRLTHLHLTLGEVLAQLALERYQREEERRIQRGMTLWQ